MELAAPRADLRQILALAFPALGVLAAMPLYLLLDTAVVGRLGGFELAALGAATTIQAQLTTQLTFLSYGTTARAARRFGAGDRSGAIAEGVQATWVALGVGLGLLLIVELGARLLSGWLSGDSGIAAEAALWLRLAAPAIPLELIIMAGNGWLRGIQNTRWPLYFTLAGVIPGAVAVPFLVAHFGLRGSALANLLGVSITAACFLAALVHSHQGSWRAQPKVIAAQVLLGKDLIIRSASFQVAFLSAAAVAARFGSSSLAAHQILLQLWNFLGLVLDSLAIAAQALTGAALGRGSAAIATAVGRKVTAYSAGCAVVLAALVAAGYQVIPRLFSSEHEVLAAVATPWWLLVLMIVLGGVVFALDGVLLGAADAVFLRNATVLAVVLGFVPGVWLAYLLDAGLPGVWCGLVAFLTLRLIAVAWRFRSGRWAEADAGI